MGVANRDASQQTKRRRNIAENSYYQGWKAAAVVGITATAPGKTGAETISEIHLGCKACVENTNADTNQQRYPPNPSSGGNTGTS